MRCVKDAEKMQKRYEMPKKYGNDAKVVPIEKKNHIT